MICRCLPRGDRYSKALAPGRDQTDDLKHSTSTPVSLRYDGHNLLVFHKLGCLEINLSLVVNLPIVDFLKSWKWNLLYHQQYLPHITHLQISIDSRKQKENCWCCVAYLALWEIRRRQELCAREHCHDAIPRYLRFHFIFFFIIFH